MDFLDHLIALAAVITIVALVLAAATGLSNWGRQADDWFRKRWGGSDAKYMRDDDE